MHPARVRLLVCGRRSFSVRWSVDFQWKLNPFLFGEFGQVGTSFGGKEKGFRWVYFSGDKVLELVSRHGGRGA
jgi:hypothetical protein